MPADFIKNLSFGKEKKWLNFSRRGEILLIALQGAKCIGQIFSGDHLVSGGEKNISLSGF